MRSAAATTHNMAGFGHITEHPGLKKGATALDGKAREVRALRVMQARIEEGLSYQAIAQKFGIGLDTVRRDMRIVEERGLLDDYRTEIIKSITPKALKAFSDTLDGGDTAPSGRAVTVATRVLEGTGLLPKNAPPAHAPTSAPGEMTLEKWVVKWREGREAADEASPADQDVIEGEIASEDPK